MESHLSKSAKGGAHVGDENGFGGSTGLEARVKSKMRRALAPVYGLRSQIERVVQSSELEVRKIPRGAGMWNPGSRGFTALRIVDSVNMRMKVAKT